MKGPRFIMTNPIILKEQERFWIYNSGNMNSIEKELKILPKESQPQSR